MLYARLLATALMVTFPLGGCVAVLPTTQSPVVRPVTATIDQLALVVPVPAGATSYATVPWHRARLTVGRVDGGMAEITHTYIGGRNGLEPIGSMPALAPDVDYWMRVDLIQDAADGTERVVGRGWVGDTDAPLVLEAGLNAARLSILPTVAGTVVALSPIVSPSLVAQDRWPDTTYHAASVRAPQPSWSYVWPTSYDSDDSSSSSTSNSSSDDDDDDDDDDSDFSTLGDVVDSGWAFQPRNPIEH